MGIKIQLFSNNNRKKQKNKHNSGIISSFLGIIIKKLVGVVITISLILLFIWIFYPELIEILI